jgi:hypothetical protein
MPKRARTAAGGGAASDAAKPAVKLDVKPAAKPAKPAVKPAAKPAKPAVKLDVKPAAKPAVKLDVKPPTKDFAQCSQGFSNHRFNVESPCGKEFALLRSPVASTHQTSMKARLVNDTYASVSGDLHFASISRLAKVRFHVSQESPTLHGSKGRVCTTNFHIVPPSKWDGNGELNRLDVRFKDCPVDSMDWDIVVDMWATPTNGDMVHLRTLIDMKGAIMETDDVGRVVTKYFTATKHELELNSGAASRHDFYLTLYIKGSLDIS